MANNRKKSATQKEFKRERQKVINALKKAKKHGTNLDEDLLPKLPRHFSQKALDELSKQPSKHSSLPAQELPQIKETSDKEKEHSSTKKTKNNKTKNNKTSSKTKTSTASIRKAKRLLRDSKKKESKQEKDNKNKLKNKSKSKVNNKPKKAKTKAPSNKKKTTRQNKTNDTKRPNNDYPTLDILDTILDKIMELPDQRGLYTKGVRRGRGGWRMVDLSGEKNTLVQILKDNIGEAEDLDALRQFYTDNQEQFIDLLEPIYYDSEEDVVMQAFAQAGLWLNQGHALTFEYAGGISLIGDNFGEGF